MTAIRLSLACCVLTLCAGLAPAARAQGSDGVPLLQGAWTGKLTSTYWDQTSAGAAKPKQKFSTKLDASIDQKGGALALTLTLNQNMLVTTSTADGTFDLTGNVGNYHLNASADAGVGTPAITLSGESDKKGKKLTLIGVFASDEITREVRIKLKKVSP